MSTYWNFDKPVYENKRYVAEFVKTMPASCENYAKTNILNYDTITSLPTEYMEADYSNVINPNSMFEGMVKCTEFPDLIMPLVTTTANIFNESGITRIPNMYLPKATGLGGIFRSTKKLINAELKKVHINPKTINAVENIFWHSGIHSLLSVFNTEYCTRMGGFFSQATNLVEVCYMNTARNRDFHDFFAGTQITGLDWEINLQCAKNVTTMLAGCTKLLDKGITLINVPRTLDLSDIGCATSKYTIKNYIETALDPSEVVD